MKLKIIVITLITLQSLTMYGQDIFEQITNKTWDGYFESFIFYKTRNGLMKAIVQYHGSGIYIVGSNIYDVEIRQDTVFLYNGLNLDTRKKLARPPKTEQVKEQILEVRLKSFFSSFNHNKVKATKSDSASREEWIILDYKFDNNKKILSNKKGSLRISEEKPILYEWISGYDNKQQIDVKLLSDIPIEKNQIYKVEDLTSILIDKK